MFHLSLLPLPTPLTAFPLHTRDSLNVASPTVEPPTIGGRLEPRPDKKNDSKKPMSATPTTMPMMIWTTWVPEPPRIPATMVARAREAMGMSCAYLL
jgi:hypothetical protein